MSIGRPLEISWIAARGTPPAIRCSKPFVTRFGSQPINRLKPFVLEGKGGPTLPRGFIRVGQLALQDFVFVAVHRPEEQEETEASRSNSSLRTIKASNSNANTNTNNNKSRMRTHLGDLGNQVQCKRNSKETYQQHPFCHQVHSRPRQPLLAT
jgi:hypothetical protein